MLICTAGHKEKRINFWHKIWANSVPTFQIHPFPNSISWSSDSRNRNRCDFKYQMGSPHVCFPNLLQFGYPQSRWRRSLQPLPLLSPGWVQPSGQSTNSDTNSRRGIQCHIGIGQPSWTLVAFASSQVTREVKFYTRGMLSAAAAICLCMSRGRSGRSKEGHAVCLPCDIQQGKPCIWRKKNQFRFFVEHK